MNKLIIKSLPRLIYRFFFIRWANYETNKFAKELEENFKPSGKTALFYPHLPSPKASVRNALVGLGYSIIADKNQVHDIAIAWHDATFKDFKNINPNALNAGCVDISKNYLDEVHQKVFGYSITLDPSKSQGKILEKSDINGAHFANIVETPVQPKEGFVYQKLLTNKVGAYYQDIRVVIVGKEMPVCYSVSRIEVKRFSAKKIKALLVSPDDFLSKDEQRQIFNLCEEMKVDFAAIDIIRHDEDQKIYAIDMNTTAFGPVHGLSLREKRIVNEKYKNSLQKLIIARTKA